MQRQMIVKAARELEMQVVPEGGSLYYMNVTQILDGHTTVEHNLPPKDAYDDSDGLRQTVRSATHPR